MPSSSPWSICPTSARDVVRRVLEGPVDATTLRRATYDGRRGTRSCSGATTGPAFSTPPRATGERATTSRAAPSTSSSPATSPPAATSTPADGSADFRPTARRLALRHAARVRTRHRRRPRAHRLSLRRVVGDGHVPRAADAAPAAARGRTRHRQDRAGRGDRREPRPAAGPAPVLRGHRRHPGALRLGLPAPDPAPARDSRRWPAGRAVPASASRRPRRACTTRGSCWRDRCWPRSNRARPCC